jgi:hypothetical protein
MAVFLTASVTTVRAQFYVGSYQEFGKNRVQYQGFKWQSFNFERFKIHFNGDGRDLAIYTARSAHVLLSEMETALDMRLDDKLEIVVYNRHSDFLQSNIGLTGQENTNVGGVTRLVGNKLFVYYTGAHDTYDDQIRLGLAEVMVANLMYGSGWKDVVKSSTVTPLPEWFKIGFIRYLAFGWDGMVDEKVKDAIARERFNKFNHLEGEEAALAGHAIWNYIAEKYGNKVVPNVFYIARASNNIENGFMLVLNVTMLNLANDFIRYYRQRYKTDDQHTLAPTEEKLPVKSPKKAELYGFRMNPAGNRMVYVTNVLGRYKLHAIDLSTNKHKVIFKAGYKMERTPDYSFPALSWHPKLDAVSFVVERRGMLQLKIHSFEDGKTTTLELRQLAKVLHMEYSPDGKEIVFSAVAEGKTDIYLYRIIGNTQTQLTADHYDDLYPSFDRTSGEIVFSSNRPTDTLPRKEDIEAFKPSSEDFDLFLLDPKGRGGKPSIRQLTDTPGHNEIRPYSSGKGTYTYISDRNGIMNRYVAYYDSAISYIDTAVHYRYFTRTGLLSNYNRNALDYHVFGKDGYGFVMYNQGRFHCYRGGGPLTMIDETTVLPTEYKRLELGSVRLQKQDDTRATQTTVVIKPDSLNVDDVELDNYQFEGDEPKYEKVIINLEERAEQEAINTNKKTKEAPEFELPQQKLYKQNFAIDYVVTQFDNNFLNASYQRYVGPGAVYFNPGINLLTRVGMTDVFEDYKLTGGFRLGGDLKSGELALQFEDLSGRTDHRYLLYRQSVLNQFEGYQVRVKTTEAKYQAKYPFSETTALRATAGYRNDQQIILAVDNVTLNEGNVNDHMANAKLELIFDNTLPKGLNLFNGTRLKVFGEYFRELTGDKANIFMIGTDIRHYQKVHREIILATRFAAGSSFGDKRLVHYLGGVDNWMFRRNPSFDETIRVDETQNYAFQTVATPMRGFIQNARNGSSFAVANAELRIPLVRYFTNRPLRSDFWNNFQLVGFFDVGTAWTGTHPYASDNTFNTIVIEQKPLVIEIENLREPIIWGYGFGFRTRIFGYFTRFDWAWGVDDFERQPSIRYFSLALDF